jgi:glycosidase
MKAPTVVLCFFLLVSSQQTRGQASISLDGEWLFLPDSLHAGLAGQWYEPSYDRTGWRTVTVPSAWERYGGLERYDGWGWYAKTVLVPRGGVTHLSFEGVDDNAVVWVNGTMVGSHTGYQDPFLFRVSGALRAGSNTIVVQVIDNGGPGGIYRSVALTDGKLRPGSHGTALKSADWVHDAAIYCAYLRSASPEGTFAGLEKRLDELSAIGVTVLWLMPIHPVGLKYRKGTLGSPYAVRDYEEVNPEFGTIVEFQKLLSAAHAKGMKVIIDLVANHTAWDSKLIVQHPEWFTRDAAGQIVSPNGDWTDVADLNYDKPELRKYMLRMMEWWVQDIGIDGYRCDVSELIPLDFWEAGRARLAKIKPVMMLSEGSLPEHHLRAFDVTYAWNLYDLLDPLLKGTVPASAIGDLLDAEAVHYPKNSLRLRFNTNHDKNAWDAPAVVKYGRDGLALTAVLCSTVPGIPLLYTGEEVANDRKLSLFEKVDVDWSRPREMETLYTTLFHLRREHKALARGAWTRVPTSHDDKVFAFLRTEGTDRALCVLNFSLDTVSTTLALPSGVGGKAIILRDAFSGEALSVARSAPSEVVLPPRGYRVYLPGR